MWVNDDSDRYSYDVVGFRSADEGIYAEASNAIGEYNTFSGRYGYRLA